MANQEQGTSGTGTKRKKKLIEILKSIGLAIVLAMACRATVAEAFVAATDAVSPEVPKGSRVLVYKLTDSFNPGDILVFRDESGAEFGRVVSSDSASVIVSRKDETEIVPRKQIVGRVIVGTR